MSPGVPPPHGWRRARTGGDPTERADLAADPRPSNLREASVIRQPVLRGSCAILAPGTDSGLGNQSERRARLVRGLVTAGLAFIPACFRVR